MRKRIKIICVIMALALSLCPLTACKSSSEKQLEKAEKAVELSEKVAAVAQSKFDRFNELMTQYDEIQEKISKLEKGTPAYEQAIEENNRLVKQIIMEFPEIEPYVETR